MDRRKTIFVVGAGGIGCAVGYALCGAGQRVIFVDTDPVKVDWGRAHGVGIDDWRLLPAEFITYNEWAPPPGAIIFLCTKCYDNAAVLKRLPSAAVLIPIQNGFDPSIETQGAALEGVASFVSECDPHRTHTRITRSGRLYLGCRASWVAASGQNCRRAQELVDGLALGHSPELDRAGIGVTVVGDILPYKYTKLMYNAAIGPLAAAAGLDNGQLLAVGKARRLFFHLLRENYRILRGAGIRLAKIGPFHPDTVHHILLRSTIASLLAWAFYPSLRGSYCSMTGDLPAGRTEIGYYNGHLIALAGNQPCPLNQRVYQLIKKMEKERIPPGLQLLDELK